jgi:hypothetical protein
LKRDKMATIGMMLTRLATLLALILGVGFGFLDWDPGLRDFHMLVGLLAIIGVLITGIRYTMLEKKVIPLWIGFILLVAGMLVALRIIPTPRPGDIHMTLMIVAIGLAEMGAAKARKA